MYFKSVFWGGVFVPPEALDVEKEAEDSAPMASFVGSAGGTSAGAALGG